MWYYMFVIFCVILQAHDFRYSAMAMGDRYTSCSLKWKLQTEVLPEVFDNFPREIFTRNEKYRALDLEKSALEHYVECFQKLFIDKEKRLTVNKAVIPN